MYWFYNIFRNIGRNCHRNIVSCLLLTAVLSVVFCNLSYASTAFRESASIENRYTRRHYVAFRDELQYNPTHPSYSAGDIRLNGTSSTNGHPDIFFDDAVMREYDRPYPATAEMYYELGTSAHCADYALAYAENVYRTTVGELPVQVKSMLAMYYGEKAVPENILTEHTVVGGSLKAFTEIARETSSTAYDFQLVEGTEPGENQCAITDFYSSLYNLTVGDSVTLYDISGNSLVELTVSGIYELYEVQNFANAVPGVKGGGRKLDGSSAEDFRGIPDIGTPYDRLGEDPEAQDILRKKYADNFRITGAMLAVIHTDFATAYNLSEDRHFNHFFAYYDLTAPDKRDDFSEAVSRIFSADFADELNVYAFTDTLEELIRQPTVLAETARSFLQLTLPLTVVIFLIVFGFALRENFRENGIYLSLGISEWDVCLKNTAENVLILILSELVAAFAGNIVYRLLSRNYIYLEILSEGYHLSTVTLWYALGCILFCTLFSVLVSVLYFRRKTPAELLRGQ